MNRIAQAMLSAAAMVLLPTSIAHAQDRPGEPPHRDHGGGDHHGNPRPAPPPGAPQPGGGRPDGRPGPEHGGPGGGGFDRGQRPGFGNNGGNGFGDRNGPRIGGIGRPSGERDGFGVGPPRPGTDGRGPGGGHGRFDDRPRDPGAGLRDDGRGTVGTGTDPRFAGHGGQGGFRPQPGRPFFPSTGGQGGYRPQPGQPGFHGSDHGPGGDRPWFGDRDPHRPGRGPGFAPGAPRWGGSHGGNWTRGWRDDRRYDWRSYRIENRFVFNLPHYYAPRGWGYGYRRFDIGVTLADPLFVEDYWIDDPYDYRLPPAYEPYRWVRYYNDALLVDLRTGYVVDAVYGIFW